eukprot:295593-Rhodomonas_salina.3
MPAQSSFRPRAEHTHTSGCCSQCIPCTRAAGPSCCCCAHFVFAVWSQSQAKEKAALVKAQCTVCHKPDQVPTPRSPTRMLRHVQYLLHRAEHYLPLRSCIKLVSRANAPYNPHTQPGMSN